MAPTLTISLDPHLEDELEKLAAERCRGSAELAAEVVADYVARECQTVAAIRRGLDDLTAGRVMPHDKVMTELRAIISAAEAARRSAS